MRKCVCLDFCHELLHNEIFKLAKRAANIYRVSAPFRVAAMTRWHVTLLIEWDLIHWYHAAQSFCHKRIPSFMIAFDNSVKVWTIKTSKLIVRTYCVCDRKSLSAEGIQTCPIKELFPNNLYFNEWTTAILLYFGNQQHLHLKSATFNS